MNQPKIGSGELILIGPVRLFEAAEEELIGCPLQLGAGILDPCSLHQRDGEGQPYHGYDHSRPAVLWTDKTDNGSMVFEGGMHYAGFFLVRKPLGRDAPHMLCDRRIKPVRSKFCHEN